MDINEHDRETKERLPLGRERDRLGWGHLAGIIASIIGISFILFGGIKNQGNFRIISDIIQNMLLFNLVILAFRPTDKEMKVASLVGLFVMGLDLALEELAVFLGWWYPLGGTRFPPVINVPLEMVLSFFPIGTSMAIVLSFPARIRSTSSRLLRPFRFLFKNERHDVAWQVLLLACNAIVGTNGDYSAGPGIWQPGVFWSPIFTFFVWFGGGLATLWTWRWLSAKL